MVTVTNLHSDDRQLIYELKITLFVVPRNTREAILKMQFRISEFLGDLMQGVGPDLASAIGRWRVTTDGWNKPHVSILFYFILARALDNTRVLTKVCFFILTYDFLTKSTHLDLLTSLTHLTHLKLKIVKIKPS